MAEHGKNGRFESRTITEPELSMTCHHCHKRLTRKGARQIDGVVMCSACMFGQRKQEKNDGMATD